MNVKLACWDCGVPIGQPHDKGCDVARCLFNGGQRLACNGGEGHNAIFDVTGIDWAEELHDCGQDIHTGQWPGEAECIEFGWYAKFTAAGWEQCGQDDPDGRPNLNRLHTGEAQWNRETLRWELRGNDE
jgi:hypothetical protein